MVAISTGVQSSSLKGLKAYAHLPRPFLLFFGCYVSARPTWLSIAMDDPPEGPPQRDKGEKTPERQSAFQKLCRRNIKTRGPPQPVYCPRCTKLAHRKVRPKWKRLAYFGEANLWRAGEVYDQVCSFHYDLSRSRHS